MTTRLSNISQKNTDTNTYPLTEPSARTSNVYKKVTSDMQFVPIGPTQGVGVAFGWKVPSFAVKMAKAKDFMIGNLPKYLEGTA